MVQAPSTVELLFEQAALLTADERALLAHWLIDSIVEGDVEKEPGYDEYWEAELERQNAALAAGDMDLVSLDEARTLMFGPTA
ncbi:addiction module protein [bacterium]|jgi:hypothetical protein|nr:addiction module protein [bacterium]